MFLRTDYLRSVFFIENYSPFSRPVDWLSVPFHFRSVFEVVNFEIHITMYVVRLNNCPEFKMNLKCSRVLYF